jgi:inosine-uridine nucleoside N-ribohydrolase
MWDGVGGTVDTMIPVILDTDIGGDMDDTWALALLLRSPELDLKLVTTCTGNTTYRARVAAKLLQIAGRGDVPLAIGPRQKDEEDDQREWVEGYDLALYPGRVHSDAARAMVDCVMTSPEPVTIVAIGPLSVVAEALEREPRIAHNARLVGMFGNVKRLHGDCTSIVPEYNVKADVGAARRVFTAPWDITITPLDSCGRVRLSDDKYVAVRDSKDRLAQAVIANYRPWFLLKNWEPYDFAKVTKSSILFDTVAVYLAFARDLLHMEDLPITITDDGTTAVDPEGKLVHCAIDWRDQNAFDDLLVRRLTAQSLGLAHAAALTSSDTAARASAHFIVP